MRARLGWFLIALAAAGCSRSFTEPPKVSAGGYVSGRVVRPVAGALQGQPEPGVSVHPAASSAGTLTDAQGLFTLGPLPAGTYRLLFERTDAQGDHRKLLDGITIRDGATASLGEVLLRDNAQVAGRVSLAGQARGNGGTVAFVSGLPFTVATGDDGAYTLSGLPEGSVAVTAFHAGYESASTPVMELQGGVVTTAQLLVLPPASNEAVGSLSGAVRLQGGDPARGATVTGQGLSTGAVAQGRTDGAGAFSLTGLQPDVWTLRIQLAGYLPVELPNLLVESGQAATLSDVVVLAPGAAPPEPDAGTSIDAGSQVDAGSPDAGVGTPCGGDADCAGGRLCVQGFCAGCQDDSGCKPGYLCRAFDCTLACGVSSDCAPGEVCNAGACGPCASSASCANGLICRGGACVVCATSADCPAGEICSASGCGPCSSTSQCPVGEVCDASGACGPCSSLNLCPSGQVCDRGACAVGSCAQAQDCQVGGSYSGEVCVGHACAACTTAQSDGGLAPCAPGTLCDANSGSCIAGNCADDSDCPGSSACVAHVCTGNCRTSADCRAVEGACGPGHLCGACQTNAQCGVGYVCTGAGQCLPGACARSSDCPSGQACDATLQCVPLATCGADAGCGAGSRCWAGGCYACDPATETCCSVTSDCPGNDYCDFGVCLPRPTNTWTLSTVAGDAAPYGGLSADDDGTLYVISDFSGSPAKLLALYPDGGTIFGPINPTTAAMSAGVNRQVVLYTLPGATERSLLWADLGGQTFVRLVADDGGTALSTGDGQRTDDTNPAVGQLADGGMRLFMVGHNDYNGYGGWMSALDADTLQLQWVANLNCYIHPESADTLVGSDGTVYTFCGSVDLEAWDPAGSAGVGRQLWAMPNPGWYSFNPHPMIARPPGEASDALYLPRGYNGYGSVVKIPVSAAGYGAMTESPALQNQPGLGMAMLPDGWLVVPTNSNVALVSPDLQSVAYPDVGGGSWGMVDWAISDDLVVYVVYNGQLEALQVTPDHQLRFLWSTFGPGGTSLSNASVILVPYAGGLELVLEAGLLGNSQRSLTAYPLSTGHAPVASPWAPIGGSNHRTSSIQIR